MMSGLIIIIYDSFEKLQKGILAALITFILSPKHAW